MSFRPFVFCLSAWIALAATPLRAADATAPSATGVAPPVEAPLSLDGIWAFTIDPALAAAPGVAGWDRLPVPGNWDTVNAYAQHIGAAWYRREFAVPSAWTGRRVRLNFGAVYESAEVSLNGVALGRHDGGHLPFDFDITDRVRRDAPNVVTVRADNTFRRGAWWAWGGISRSVTLTSHHAVRLVRQHVRAEPDLAARTAEIFIEYKLENAAAATATSSTRAPARPPPPRSPRSASSRPPAPSPVPAPPPSSSSAPKPASPSPSAKTGPPSSSSAPAALSPHAPRPNSPGALARPVCNVLYYIPSKNSPRSPRNCPVEIPPALRFSRLLFPLRSSPHPAVIFPSRRFPAALRSLVLAAAAPFAHAAEEPVSFNEHIRPILADNCFACHGSDAAHRKAKLRLDQFESATADRDGFRALIPGDVANSEVWQRIISTDPDEIMPPPDSHKPPLKAAQRDLVRRWIEQGAVYQNHWAFEPISRPAIPVSQRSAPNSQLSQNPIDAFIRQKLARQKLTPAPAAPPEVLLRRLTLDLTGLPPTPAELAAFLSDPIKNQESKIENLVARLLASPRYGEHFARHWLDAVRYSDTHGLHLDNIRHIWSYRDWVVRAFNANLPFDRFTLQQLAGDLLPDAELQSPVSTPRSPNSDPQSLISDLPSARLNALIASGYNRLHLTTSEGGAIEAEAEARNTADRTDTTAAVFLGLTAGCAACHDHKFDPLTQRDYYALGAFWKSLADRPWDGNVRVSAPVVVIADSPAKQARIAELDAAVRPLETALATRTTQLLADSPPAKLEKEPITYEVIWAEDSDLANPTDLRAPAALGEWRSGPDVPVAGGQRALRLEGGKSRPFNFNAGDVILTVRSDAKAFVHFLADPAQPPRAISLELISETQTTRFVWGDPTAFSPKLGGTRHVGPLPPPGAYARLEIDACEAGFDSGKTYTGLSITQSDGAAWWDRAGATLTSPDASADPLLSRAAWNTNLQANARFNEGMPLRHDIKYLIGLSGTQQNDEEKTRLDRYHREHIYAPYRAALEPEAHAARRLLAEQIHYELTNPMTLVSGERPVPLPAHILLRGQYDKPGDLVEPATPSFLPPLRLASPALNSQPSTLNSSASPRATRLDFARWLVDPQNPLTARVTVNRFWQQLFGAGLVRTPGDFGVQGDAPTHPELLDWLASEFVRSGWDVKKLVRLIVTSETYRQSSDVTPALLDLDPTDRLLARAPRLRLDGEVLRDQALALSGLLVPTIGGTPVRPYQPINIWEPVAFGGSNTKTYVRDDGPALYRRSLYTFWKRTAPAPAMSTFDAPSRETFCTGRGRSNTPLQALALMNDVQQFEAARAFAENLLAADSADTPRLAAAFRAVTSREPDATERDLLATALATHRAHYAKDPDAAEKVLTNGASKSKSIAPAPEIAAWTMVANLLFNLDETITRN